MPEEYILTTTDNEFDYFTQFEEWFNRDRELGHNCCGIVAAISPTSKSLSHKLNVLITNQAIKSFVENDFLGIYKIVTRNDKKE